MDNEPTQPQASPPPEEKETRHMSPEEAKRELQDAIKGSNQVLASASTVLTIFPDTLTIDRAKLTVTHREFFSTAEVMSIRIEDILNVTVNLIPFLGSLKIVSRVFNAEKPYEIGFFKRDDALKLKRVIQGYIIALQRSIDCNSLPTHELASMLEKLGEDDHTQ